MRLKQLSLIVAVLLFSLACSLLQSRPPVGPAPASGTGTTQPQAAYELFDESPAPDRFSIVRVGKTDEALASILSAEAAKAAGMGRHPFVEFYADWCPPCKAIQNNLGDQRMIDAFAGTYVIKLDLDYWQSRLSHTGFYVPGIPAFYELNPDGSPTGRMITGAAWGEDIPENIAPPLQRFFSGDDSH